jgi:hypothetical protein
MQNRDTIGTCIPYERSSQQKKWSYDKNRVAVLAGSGNTGAKDKRLAKTPEGKHWEANQNLQSQVERPRQGPGRSVAALRDAIQQNPATAPNPAPNDRTRLVGHPDQARAKRKTGER